MVGTLFIAPGSSWENGYSESFNGKLRDELLDREIFYTLQGPGSSSRGGGSTITPLGRTVRSAISHPPPRRRRSRRSPRNRSLWWR
jgi:hypothetical protein